MTGTESTSVYQVAGTPALGAGVAGCAAERLNTISTLEPSANTRTGTDQSSTSSVPVTPSAAATAADAHAGAEPVGIVCVQPSGAVSVCVAKL